MAHHLISSLSLSSPATVTVTDSDSDPGTVAENIQRGRYDPESSVHELVPEIDEFLQSQVVNCFGRPPAVVTASTDTADHDTAAPDTLVSNSAYRQVKGQTDEDEGDIELGLESKKQNETLGDDLPASVASPAVMQEGAVISADILRAGRLSHAHNFVSAFPQGYHTDVGEGSIMISGGQKQRIAIARAIVKEPHILLLDEATSALDAASERLVQESIDSLQSLKTHTSIVIAHRLTTIKSADTIVVMDRGQVVESGTHEDLLQLNQLYAKLWQRQQGGRDRATSDRNAETTEMRAAQAKVLQMQ